METITHDLIILGSGLAGLRAALEAAKVSAASSNIALVSKLQLMRAHSVAAEGGTAAVLRADEGDSLELHAWDTVKGSDFLADQDAVDFFVREMPQEILQLDRWGLPWSRRPDGRIAQRPFGGHRLSARRLRCRQDRLSGNADAVRYAASSTRSKCIATTKSSPPLF